MSRPTCWNCRRVQSLCFCSRLRPFKAEPLIVLLVHPREYKKSVGTAHLVKLSISNSVTLIGKGPDFDQDPIIRTILANPDYYPVVLYPGARSVSLENPEAGWNPEGKRLAIFVIDGTWSLAVKMLRLSRVLQDLPRVSFEVKTRSIYRFRRQPDVHCLSTVEATHQLLDVLTPQQRSHHHMLDVFHWMVDRQVEFTEHLKS